MSINKEPNRNEDKRHLVVIQKKSNSSGFQPAQFLGPAIFVASSVAVTAVLYRYPDETDGVGLMNEHAQRLISEGIYVLRFGQILGLVIAVHDLYVMARYVADGIVLNDFLSDYISPSLQGCCSLFGLYASPLSKDQRRMIIEEACKFSDGVLVQERNALLEPGGYANYVFTLGYGINGVEKDEIVTPDSVKDDKGTLHDLKTTDSGNVLPLKNTNDPVEDNSQVRKKEVFESFVDILSNIHSYDWSYENIIRQVQISAQSYLPSQTEISALGTISAITLILYLKKSKDARQMASAIVRFCFLFSLAGNITGSFVLSSLIGRTSVKVHPQNALNSATNVFFQRLKLNNLFSISKKKLRSKNKFLIMFATFFLIRNRTAIKTFIFGGRKINSHIRT